DLLADLKGPADAALYRIELHHTDDPDPRDQLAHQTQLGDGEFQRVHQALARLDRARAWTFATLQAIQQQPGSRAGDLAPALGWAELAEFKLHVRKLKALGLTISLRVGYRLSPRGEAYLQRLGSEAVH